MSELKAYKMVDEKYCTDCLCVIPSEVYLKSEADKVIAELEKEIDELQDKVTDLLLRDRNMALNFNNAVDALVHNKYKRCLAMARFCEERYNYLTCLENWQMTDKEYQQAIGDYWDRWHNRWLELAERFKEAK